MFISDFQRAVLPARTGFFLLVASLVMFLTAPAQANELDRFDPATTDPELFRIAVRHSERLKVPDNNVKVLVVMTDRKSGRVLKEKKIFLERTTAAEDAPLPANGQGQRVSIYRIPERQISEIRALQAKFLAMPKERQNEIAGSLSIDVSGCKIDPDDTGQMLISTFLRSSEFTDYVVLAKDYDLRNVPTGGALKNADPVRPCR